MLQKEVHKAILELQDEEPGTIKSKGLRRRRTKSACRPVLPSFWFTWRETRRAATWLLHCGTTSFTALHEIHGYELPSPCLRRCCAAKTATSKSSTWARRPSCGRRARSCRGPTAARSHSQTARCVAFLLALAMPLQIFRDLRVEIKKIKRSH